MNKTIIININSIVFHIEEDAYETLRSYMIEIKRHFSQSADSGEILLDIENRVAEMFTERIQQGKKEVIAAQDVEIVIAQMGRVSDFEDIADGPYVNENKEEPSRLAYEKKLMRNGDDKVLGGVCSGLGYYFGIQTKWVRILFVLFFIFGGSGVLLYIVLWIVMPIATSRADRMAMRGEEPNLQNFKKNYEEELEHYKEDLSNENGQQSKGSQSVSNGIATIFSIIGKGFVFMLLIFSGMTIFGMLITLIGFGSAIIGLQNQMAFPGLDVLPQEQAFLALFAGVLAITIPFLALFHVLIRILFKTKPMNNYLSLSLWAGWIASVLLVVFFALLGAREFKEDSTIKIDKPLVKQDIYYFSEKDIRVIEASTLDNGQKKYKIQVDGEELSAYLKSDINIRFEYLNEGEAPYIQYNYYAKGKTYQAATKRASDINYIAIQDNGKITFDSHFSLGESNDFRDQSVTAVVYLPISAKIVIDQSLRYKVRGFDYYACQNSYSNDNVKSTEWVMMKTGLTCAPDFYPLTDIDSSLDMDTAERELERAGEEIERKAKEMERKIERAAEAIERKAEKLDPTTTNSSN